MRTTLTLDEDVAAKLKEQMKKKGLSFKEAVNSTLRKGLNEKKEYPKKSFKVRAQDMKARDGINFDNIGELLDQIEGPGHK